MTPVPDVVVTGMGATTPLGGDLPSTWRAALAGESGARPFDNDWVERYGLPVTFAATIKVPPREVLPVPELKKLDPSAQYAMIATREAWADAGAPEVDGDRLGGAAQLGAVDGRDPAVHAAQPVGVGGAARHGPHGTAGGCAGCHEYEGKGDREGDRPETGRRTGGREAREPGRGQAGGRVEPTKVMIR